MFDDSDDDEVLLPSVGAFENMFANLQRQAKQELTTKPLDRTPSSSTSKAESKIGAGRDSRKNSKSSSDKTQEKASSASEERGKGLGPKRNIISKDTVDLLAALDNLKKPGGTAASSSTATKRTKEKQDVSKTTRKKKGSKAIEEITISSSSEEDLGLGEDTEDMTYEFDSSQNDTEEVRPAVEYSTLRIRWKADQWLRFEQPHGTKMSKIRMDVAEQLNLRADNLVILDEKDSEEISDNMVVENIPFGAALEVFERVNNIASKDAKKLGPNCVQLKVQGSGGYRERIVVVIQRTTHIKQLMDDFIEKFGYHGKKFKLVFDGDVADLDETPESLDLDGGEMFDIVEVP